jgi:hypothetical protein
MSATAKRFGELGLVLFCIYLVAGGIYLMLAILQGCQCAQPFLIGALSLLIAFLAKLVIKDDIQRAGSGL